MVDFRAPERKHLSPPQKKKFNKTLVINKCFSGGISWVPKGSQVHTHTKYLMVAQTFSWHKIAIHTQSLSHAESKKEEVWYQDVCFSQHVGNLNQFISVVRVWATFKVVPFVFPLRCSRNVWDAGSFGEISCRHLLRYLICPGGYKGKHMRLWPVDTSAFKKVFFSRSRK